MQYTLKNKPSDFIVVEDMDIEHSGNGEHLWLWVEKQNLTTDVAKSLLGKAFDVQLRNVSAAGKTFKDFMEGKIEGQGTPFKKDLTNHLSLYRHTYG